MELDNMKDTVFDGKNDLIQYIHSLIFLKLSNTDICTNNSLFQFMKKESNTHIKDYTFEKEKILVETVEKFSNDLKNCIILYSSALLGLMSIGNNLKNKINVNEID